MIIDIWVDNSFDLYWSIFVFILEFSYDFLFLFIDLFDTRNKRLIRSSVNGHEGGIRDLDVSPDGALLVSASNDGSIRLQYLANKEQ